MDEFSGSVVEFRAEARRRAEIGDPEWTVGATIPPAVVASVQRFQVGEAGDGANLIAKASGRGDYSVAVRLFVAEEQNHARMLASLLEAAGAPTIASHWSDAVFVRLRRALGLRVELLVLVVAEVIALGYYRLLRDGTGDPLVTEVAGRILADEERHVPFHCRRLRGEFAGLPAPARTVVFGVWRVLLFGASLVVAHDHGPALRALGTTRRGFVVEVNRLFDGVLAAEFASSPLTAGRGRTDHRPVG
ncbi:ferritin-like domain-containing protein [Umezawaea sp.]|uniref:ferritin-like domain-containing protein n=1 Tax=Umezawaea sp. TaxID=1955258 RepID=UPI002ED4C40C